jgi:hypothetical protein
VPEPPDALNGELRRALLIDWGGVLTTNLFTSFHAYCLAAGIPPERLMGRFRTDPAARELLITLETGKWGVHRYPREMFAELFDGVVISAEEGIRKPSRRMYELGAERAGVPSTECVYVDDLPFNLTPAQELGMATVHHTSAETSIPELERLLGVALSAEPNPAH